MTYLIWSYEHNAWWAPDSKGYRRSVDAAGRYSQDHASRIVAQANRFGGIREIAIPVPLALSNAEPKFHPYDGALAHA